MALNRFATDTEDEIDVGARALRASSACPSRCRDHFARGGEGARRARAAVVERAERQSRPFRPLYELERPGRRRRSARSRRRMYGARGVVLTQAAPSATSRELRAPRLRGPPGLHRQDRRTSLSDDPHLRGRPRDFDVTVREIQINAGAGFLVVLTGDILRMPGLPKRPLAERIDLRDGEIVGVG